MPEEQGDMLVNARRQSSYAKAMESPVPLQLNLPIEEEEESSEFPPEIFIPPPVFCPLPLQCLAADALPDAVKREIEDVISECSCCGLTESIPPRSLDVEAISEGEGPGLEVGKHLLLKRNNSGSDLVNDLGIGARIIGGLKCDCGELHAVISATTDNKERNPGLREGLCVVEWCGVVLEGGSYEQVKTILRTTERKEEVEVVVKECSKLKGSRSENDRKHNPRLYSALQNPDHYTAHTPSPQKVLEIQGDMTEELRILRSVNPELSLSSNSLEGGGVSPQETDQFPKSKSTSNLLTLPQEGPTKTNILPKSPTISGSDYNLEDFFACLPNGMVKVSMMYRKEDKTLGISLDQVKGHSSSGIGNTSDVFINTYLIPDTREQGVRSTKVNEPTSSDDPCPSYDIKQDELETLAMRIILWEIEQKQRITFRGEVLLGLNDSEIVNVNGEPTWYTVCAVDPNLPPLPAPVHYKSLQTLWQGTEHLLTFLKQKVSSGQAQALSYFRQHTKKQKAPSQRSGARSSGQTPGLPVVRRHLSLPTKEGKNQSSGNKRSSGEFSLPDMDSKEVRIGSNGGSLSPKRSARLAAILAVLQSDQQSEGSEEDDELSPSFSQTKLSAILEVLKDDPPPVDSPDIGYLLPESPEDDREFSTLDRRVRRRPAGEKGHENERNESFRFIPDLKDSLNAGRKKPFIIYSFRNEERTREQEGPETEDRSPDHWKTPSRENSEEGVLYALDEQSESEKSPLSPSPPQLHYKLYDCQDGNEEEAFLVDAAPKASSLPRRKWVHEGHRAASNTADCGVYPAEVSLRITPATLERKPGNTGTYLSEDRDAFIPPSTHQAEGHTQKTSSLGNHARPVERPASTRKQRPRSRSVGDVLGLEMGELGGEEDLPDSVASSISDLESSLDIGGRDGKPGMQPPEDLNPTRYHHPPRQRARKKLSLPGFRRSTEDSHVQKPRRPSLATWKSFDDLLESLPVPKPVSKKLSRRKNSTTSVASHSQEHPTLQDIPRQACSVKLELSYSPAEPVLVVDLIDVVFAPIKANSSDFVFKASIYHSSTGVCLVKRKTTVSLWRTSKYPLATLQFDTDITNLSLRVCLVHSGKLFSKKTTAEASIDLNSLDLRHTHSLSQWFSLTKAEQN